MILKLSSIVLLFTLISFNAKAQSPTTVDSLRLGDVVVFSEDPSAKKFVVIGLDAQTLSCSILNDGGELDTVVVRKSTVVQAFKHSLNRKRMNTFLPGSKLRWKQYGKRVEGFLESYSPADPDLTVTVYTDEQKESRRVPVKYVTPTYQESMADTMQWLCKLWEAPDQLFAYVQVDSAVQGLPRMEYIELKKTMMSNKVQYVMEDYKFAMVFKENLENGIVGSWKMQDELLIVTTKIAAIKEKGAKKKAIQCKADYRFEFELADEGNTLKLRLIDWDIYEAQWERIEEEQRQREAERKRLEEERLAMEEALKNQDEFDSAEPDIEMNPGSTPPPPPVRIDDRSRGESEIDLLRQEIKLLKEEMKKLREELKKQNSQ